MVFVYERAYVPHAIMHHCNSKTKANHQKNECETIYAKDWPNERFDHVFHANIYSPTKEKELEHFTYNQSYSFSL